jgi:hypothetical protein
MTFSVSLAVQLQAIELKGIPRNIVKQPKFETKQPRYCLLAFGQEAKTLVWLIQDGGTLYVDRNANGDLTDADEMVAATSSSNADERIYYFSAGDIHDGSLTHKDLLVTVGKLDHLASSDEGIRNLLAKAPETRFYSLGVYVDMPDRKGVGIGGRVQHTVSVQDTVGFLVFSDKPEDAPIIHLGGDWQVTLFGPHRLTVGRQRDVVLGVGTKGLGPGTTAFIGYEELIPDGLYPKVEITYPPEQSGEPSLKELYELKHRC